MTDAAAASLEARLAAGAGRAACVLTGTATTAIYLALCIVRERAGPGEAIVPAITCPAVAQAVIYAGLDPVFADVTIPDCTHDVAAVRKLIGPRTRAIVAIHTYGNAAPMAETLALAAAHGIAVVEDVAQATGGTLDERPLGSFGDFSVHSFGGTKIVTAGGGGALLTDDRAAAARARELLAALPPSPPHDEAQLALGQRNLTIGLGDVLRADPTAIVGGTFRDVVPAYRRLWLHALPPESSVVARITGGLDDLAANLAQRRALAERYHDALAPLEPHLRRSTAWQTSGVVWRYSFLAPDPAAAIRITGALRAAGLPASNHYWSVAQLFRDQRLPVATEVSRRVVNLWVDRTTAGADADRAINTLRRVA